MLLPRYSFGNYSCALEKFSHLFGRLPVRFGHHQLVSFHNSVCHSVNEASARKWPVNHGECRRSARLAGNGGKIGLDADFRLLFN